MDGRLEVVLVTGCDCGDVVVVVVVASFWLDDDVAIVILSSIAEYSVVLFVIDVMVLYLFWVVASRFSVVLY